jgi:hypothetical protein
VVLAKSPRNDTRVLKTRISANRIVSSANQSTCLGCVGMKAYFVDAGLQRAQPVEILESSGEAFIYNKLLS